MSEKPIIFSAEMVRAILHGRKTQTRQVLKPAKDHKGWPCPMWPVYMDGKRIWETSSDPEMRAIEDANGSTIWTGPTPIAPGDELWVRETWMPAVDAGGSDWRYAADYDDAGRKHMDAILRWRPSIHMPRSASRITLRVIAIKVERVQDISREDEIAEGCPDGTFFDSVWDSIHGKHPDRCWAANPWVAAIRFERVQP